MSIPHSASKVETVGIAELYNSSQNVRAEERNYIPVDAFYNFNLGR
jgi:hypothetical protein